MRDKVSTENVEMMGIKWERFWNNDREEKNGEGEREMHRAMNHTYYHYELSCQEEHSYYDNKADKNRVASVAKENSRP